MCLAKYATDGFAIFCTMSAGVCVLPEFFGHPGR